MYIFIAPSLLAQKKNVFIYFIQMQIMHMLERRIGGDVFDEIRL